MPHAACCTCGNQHSDQPSSPPEALKERVDSPTILIEQGHELITRPLGFIKELQAKDGDNTLLLALSCYHSDPVAHTTNKGQGRDKTVKLFGIKHNAYPCATKHQNHSKALTTKTPPVNRWRSPASEAISGWVCLPEQPKSVPSIRVGMDGTSAQGTRVTHRTRRAQTLFSCRSCWVSTLKPFNRQHLHRCSGGATKVLAFRLHGQVLDRLRSTVAHSGPPPRRPRRRTAQPQLRSGTWITCNGAGDQFWTPQTLEGLSRKG